MTFCLICKQHKLSYYARINFERVLKAQQKHVLINYRTLPCIAGEGEGLFYAREVSRNVYGDDLTSQVGRSREQALHSGRPPLMRNSKAERCYMHS
jgi:hypothetical protein